MDKGYDSKFFVKKKKQKYPRNKFFSYSGVNRNDKNFNYKDFRNSNSTHTTFNKSTFYGTLFKKSTLKYCSFNGAVFVGITFINCNFKGSRFLGATFDNCVFSNCKFENCKFKGAKFINSYVKNSSFKNSSNLKLDLTISALNNLTLPENKLVNRLKNKYNNTNVESLINKIEIARFLKICSLKKLIIALDIIKNNSKIQSAMFSHVLAKSI